MVGQNLYSYPIKIPIQRKYCIGIDLFWLYNFFELYLHTKVNNYTKNLVGDNRYIVPKIIQEAVQNAINESSLNRVSSWMKQYDIACVSAYRDEFKNSTPQTLDERQKELINVEKKEVSPIPLIRHLTSDSIAKSVSL